MEKLQNTPDSKSHITYALEGLIAIIPGSLYWKDLNGRYLGCNLFMVKVAKLNSVDDIIGKTDFELWPESAEKLTQHDRHIINTGATLELEESVLVDGKLLHFVGVKMPLRDENNNIIGVIGSSLDITDLKNTQKELERINQVQRRFIANTEHDIGTPLFGIRNMMQIFSEQETDPNKKRLFTMVYDAAVRISHYCQNLKNFANYEKKRKPILEKRIDLYELIDNIIKLEAPAAFTKKLEFNCTINPDVPRMILSDDYRLIRILMNVVGNAIKFTDQGFVKITVCLEKHDVESRAIIISFIIEDSGIGIPEDKLTIIYERFAKLSPSNQERYRGEGLGLTAVRKFVKDLEGEIFCKSVLDKGSTFTVTIPAKKSLSQL